MRLGWKMATKKVKLSAYERLEKEFDEKVEALQSKCKHKKLTKWMEYHWAFGHSTGTHVKICERCNKHVYQKSKVNICNLCGEINSIWMLDACIECKAEGTLIPYIVIKKNGKITWKRRVKKNH